MANPQIIGVDIGGTFTDCVVSDGGMLRIHKLPSTPANPAEAMLAGLAALGMTPGARVAHGSTVATNALLERRGARAALLATAGFRDLLAIGRQDRPHLYALQPQIPPPIIPRQWCFDVPERLEPDGSVATSLDLAALEGILDVLDAERIESVAVCLLYSFANPVHERQIRARLLARGWQPEQIALSCEVLPEFREYERAATTAAEAFLRPVVAHYLASVEAGLARSAGSMTPRLLVMQSDGGVVPAPVARRQAARMALSGPAAGVIGAAHLARLAGIEGIITLDIGGTSTDVALCPGAPLHRTETIIAGVPLHLPMLAIETIGAGGGSIAWRDAGDALRVGPQSAGADPGPIVYGRGGTAPTVSDAHAVLGRLPHDTLLGGAMVLHVEPARQALAAFAADLHLPGADAAARGIVTIANTHIQRALRRITVEQGYDPRAFTLVAFGGAGPLHACEVARALGVRRVLIPQHPGMVCALGLLLADVTRSASRTLLVPARDAGMQRGLAAIEAMLAELRAALVAEGIPPDAITGVGSMALRYQGQSYELDVPASLDAVAAFHALHQERYGYAMPERAVELVTARARVTAVLPRPSFAPEPIAPNDGSTAITGRQPLRLESGAVLANVYDRARLSPGATFTGPAIIAQYDATCLIPPGWRAEVEAHRQIILHDLE